MAKVVQSEPYQQFGLEVKVVISAVNFIKIAIYRLNTNISKKTDRKSKMDLFLDLLRFTYMTTIFIYAVPRPVQSVTKIGSS